jgi:hypothetical protein
LTLNARPQKTNPITRGYFTRVNLLCQPIQMPQNPPVPINPLPEQPTPGETTRQELDAHVKDPYCAACHNMLDPPGFALENFDQVGRHRTTDNGQTVDTSGAMVSSGDLDGPFAQGSDLLKHISSSVTVKTCFAQQVFEFAMSGNAGTSVAMEDQCALGRLGQTFSSAGNLNDLESLIATSTSFRLRQSEGVAP